MGYRVNELSPPCGYFKPNTDGMFELYRIELTLLELN